MTTAERIAEALETIAASVEEPNDVLVHRVAQLEMIVSGFVALMKNPVSRDQDWVDLLEDAENTLGVEEGVTQ